MGEYSVTLCDCCAADVGASYGDPGFFEGPASSVVYEGWGIAVRKYRTKPMTLSSGYVIESRDAEETHYICAACLKDDDIVETYRFGPWTPDRYDGEHLVAAIKRLEDAEEAEYEREMRVWTMRMWLDLNGAPDIERRPGLRLAEDYDAEREHWRAVAEVVTVGDSTGGEHA